MKYGRHQIDKAGEIIMSAKSSKEYDDAMQKINEWRTLHLEALDALQNEILPLLKQSNIAISLTSRRLKRITSILYKLDINPEMRLGGMQDIGGFRIVVNDIDALHSVKKILTEQVPRSFDLIKIMDYVQTPKESGYRSIHFIYKYKSADSNTDGAKIELQVRTRLQHSWAMAVETAGLITRTPLKSSMGSDEWLDFFKIVSSLFAIKEKQPILKMHIEKKYDIYSLMKLLYEVNLREISNSMVLDTKENVDQQVIEITAKVLENKRKIDQVISNNLKNYTIYRLNKVDLAIIELACYEMMFTDLNKNIVINEALEISKIYTKIDQYDSSKFNNRLLDTIAKYLEGLNGRESLNS